MSESTITSKSQVTIPVDIRRALGLSTGDRVVFTCLGGGMAVMGAKTCSVLELQGLLKAAAGKRTVTIADMNIGRS